MTEDKTLEQKIDDIGLSVLRIEQVLCGDAQYKQEGLIDTVKKHDDYINMDKKLKWTIAGAVGVVGFIVGILLKVIENLDKINK